LALFYAQKAVKLSTNIDDRSEAKQTEEFRITKDRLQDLLNTLDNYDATTLLQSIRHCKLLQRETAIVLGRVSSHCV